MFGIDNWRRDFRTNSASTDPAADDPDLQPLRSPLSPPELSERVVSWSARERPWRVVDLQRDTDGTMRLHLVRTTRWFRFKDDVRVSIHPQPDGGSLMEVTSKSRIGKGDLGQNPRNIRELIRRIRA